MDTSQGRDHGPDEEGKNVGPAREVDAWKLADKEAGDGHGKVTKKGNQTRTEEDKTFELANFLGPTGHEADG